jgi:hypothetical protein
MNWLRHLFGVPSAEEIARLVLKVLAEREKVQSVRPNNSAANTFSTITETLSTTGDAVTIKRRDGQLTVLKKRLAKARKQKPKTMRKKRSDAGKARGFVLNKSYDKDLSSIVEDIKFFRAQGHTADSIAAVLNTRGYKTKYGKKFTASSVYGLMKNHSIKS